MASALQQFFQAVLPRVGVFVTAYVSNGKVKQRTYKSQTAVADFCGLNQMNAADCWFAVASYKQGWHEVETAHGTKSKLRTQDNAWYAKSLWLDVDVGEDKPYKTRQEASHALAVFIKDLGLPRPWVIGSGKAGLHLYFAFDEEVEKEQWQYLADRLKQACKEKGIHADPSRTADIASIMRCPLTWNMKGTEDGGQAHQVQILVHGASASYDTIKQALDKFTPTVDRTNRMPALPTLDLSGIQLPQLDSNEILAKYFAPIKAEYPTRPAIEVLAGCEQMRLQNGASEPVWRGMLATLRHCEHGRYVAHKVSAIDPRYSTVDTDTKLNYLEDNDIAPYTCNTFASLRPEVCQRCPNRGMINSPISVPKRPRTIPVQQVQEPPAQQVDAPQITLPTIQLPPLQAGVEKEDPQREGASGALQQEDASQFAEIKTKNHKVNAAGCWARTKNSDGEWYWQNIYPYPIYPLQRVRGRTAKGETTISYILRKYRHNGYDDIQMEGSTLMGQTLNATLGNYGFLLTDKERKLMAGLLIDILKETESTIGEVQTTDRLGWNDTYDTFLLGNKLYKTDGKVFEIAVMGKAKVFSDMTVPTGSLELWKKIANVYNKDGLEWGQATVASAFASPLMPFGALEKAALLFVTGHKGVGKSTALKLAISVFGNSDRMMINKDDTYLARLNKLGIMNNIAAGFDEMTDLSPKEASELAYQITQGRGKDRMASGGEDMMLNTTYWSCLPVMSANDSIINALSQHGLDPTAQMSRVLEVQATDINKLYTPDEVEANERLVRQLPHNFGVAGDVYIRYITAHKEEVQEMIYQIEKRFKEHAGLNSNYRFWTYMCTRMIVGVMIANKLGLLQYNVAKLFVYLVKQVKRAKADIEKYKWTPESAVPQFLTANIPHRLVVTHGKRPSDMQDNEVRGVLNDINYVVQAPAHGRELTMRVELDTGNCVISLAAIKEWCRRSGIGFNEFMKLIEDQYVVVTKRTRRDLGKQTVYRGGGSTDCIIVNMPKHLFEPEQE